MIGFIIQKNTWWCEQQKLGTLAVEMETHILYALANKFNKEALSVCTVADHFEKPFDNMDSYKRQTSFTRMVETVFDLAVC